MLDSDATQIYRYRCFDHMTESFFQPVLGRTFYPIRPKDPLSKFVTANSLGTFLPITKLFDSPRLKIYLIEVFYLFLFHKE